MSISSRRHPGVSAGRRLFLCMLVWLVVPICYAQDPDPTDYLGDSSVEISANETVARPILQPRIIGGTPVLGYPIEYPWMAALVSSYSQDIFDGLFCGGTLIAPRWDELAPGPIRNVE